MPPVASASPFVSVDDAMALLAEADRLHARALELFAQAAPLGGVARGLPVDWLLRMEARRARWDARDLVSMVESLRRMPQLAILVRDGIVSSSQLRAIARAITPVPVAARARVDALIARRARTLVSAEPEQLIHEVEDLVARIRADRTREAEERAIERNFLALQPRLGGGGTMYGEADEESFATIAAALDAAAERPEAGEDDDDEPRSRARQRLEALTRICEQSLGGSSGGRARPRVNLIIDASDLDAGARMLAPVATRPMRLSALAANVALCDSIIQPFVFDGHHPIGVGDARATIPDKVRAAVTARDGGCRFPGCLAPAAWSDAHHIVPRARGGDASVTNLVLLCRRCHRRVHRGGWRVGWDTDGSLSVRARGRRYVSHPRARPPTGR